MDDAHGAPARFHLHYLDWLKVLIVYGIAVFHVSLVFAGPSWLVTNAESSPVLAAFAGFCFPWGIPAMFLIAGADSWFGLRSRRPLKFLEGRFVRLVLPMVAGILVLSPMQRYLTMSSPPPPLRGMLAWYPTFYRGIRLDWTPEWLGQYGLHLWFLGYLFGISAVCLPLMAWLRTGPGRAATRWLFSLTRHRGGIFVFLVPLAISQAILRQRFPAYQDWADIATYAVVFMAGYILVSERRFEASIVRDGRLALGFGIAGTIGVGLLLSISGLRVPQPPPLNTVYQLSLAFFWSLNIWSWLVAVLALGIRWLNTPNRVIDYCTESVLPFYVIHHPVVIVVATAVVGWDLPLWPKFFLILGAVYGITLLLYEFLVRRWRPVRALFGLRPLPRLAYPGRLSVPPAHAA